MASAVEAVRWAPFNGASGKEPLRIAVLSTGRSGTMWTWRLLSLVYQLPRGGIQKPRTFDWTTLPARCIIHTHVPPERDLVETLAAQQVRVITLARHPLDVLISHLQFAQHRQKPWALDIQGATPTSERFFDFANSTRAAKILAVSRHWWQETGVSGLRYEDLVKDTAGQIEALVQRIAIPPLMPVPKAVKQTGFERLAASEPGHYWRGQPGLWRSLLPAEQALRIGELCRANLELWDYALDPNPTLSVEQAERTWLSLALPPKLAEAPAPEGLPRRGPGDRLAGWLRLPSSLGGRRADSSNS